MATDVTVTVPTDEAIGYIADNMRRADREEVWATGGYSPLEAITASVEVSDPCFVVLFGGEAGVVFGSAPAAVSEEPLVGLVGREWADVLLNARLGIVWALTATIIDQRPLAFYKASQANLERITGGYDYVLNFVDARNERSLRWLESLGFEVLPAVPFGNQQLPFCPVILEVNRV